MKYVVLLCDGMADYPNEVLGGLTPMSKSVTPNMDKLAKDSVIGLVKTVADGLKPGSDVANLSVLGYDPAVCYTGRSPLEAGSIGIDMLEDDVSFRCNLVTVSEEENFEDRTLVDYCADDISTAEAKELVTYLASHFDNDEFKLYSGVSYRHCLIWHKGTLEVGTLTPPHDITGRKVTEYIPNHPNAEKLFDMMKKSYVLLKDHPVNKAREARGLRPANCIWLWGEGKRANLADFKATYGLNGTMISAVDLLKGIGKFANMSVVDVEGATGYIDTNFKGKAEAAVKALADGQDFVYIHVEAPDECGHRNEPENKVKSLEIIDKEILGAILPELDKYDDYKIMILPDHPTPLALKTHTSDPVPFMIYTKSVKCDGKAVFTEETAKETGVFIEKGPSLMKYFIDLHK
ncbi:MAG: cofactor-independent phosphoglycerate mutase [Oscillospiraceae bacterium]|nr:cofactor-independent phosphoglycerate mutase [Oscillospiraceae bacterium]